MKIHVLSDLHTELADFEPPSVEADVVVLAGDIGVGVGGIDWAAKRILKKPIIYVPGNHEYYNYDISLTGDLRSRTPSSNVHVLNDETLVVGGVRFLGCTLWTDFRLFGDDQSGPARECARGAMDDFKLIKNGSRLFTPEDSEELHEKSKAWLTDTLRQRFKGPTVVITHHLPALPSVAEQFSTDPLSPAFASKLEPMIQEYRPDLWIHGHSHIPCDYSLFGTRVVSNPRGYPNETQFPRFRSGLVVTVQ